MFLPPFPRHSWRPLPAIYTPIPEHAHMLYGHPQEGVCTHYGWRSDGAQKGPCDQYRVCVPDTVTIIPVLVTEEDQLNCGVTASGNALPMICMQAAPLVSESLQCATGAVILYEDPRDAAARILLETFGLTVKDYFASLVYQPDPRIESLNYTFVMRGLGLKKDSSKKKKSSTKKKKPQFVLKRPSEVFSLVGQGKLVGDFEFFRRLIISHGYANAASSFGLNVGNSAAAYTILGDCVKVWDCHRGTTPPVRPAK